MATVTVGYTWRGDPESEQRVQQDLRKVVRALRSLDCRAILLAGAFGGGEGLLRRTGDGSWETNDYDLVVVSDLIPPAQVQEALRHRTEAEVGVPIDLTFRTPAALSTAEPTLFHFDLRYAGRVIDGAQDILEQMPRYRPSDLSALEAVRLIFNRLAGILGASCGAASSVSARDLRIQLLKALVACGDAMLMLEGIYQPRYAVRRRRFAEFASAHRSTVLRAELARQIDGAYAARLDGDNGSLSEPVMRQTVESVARTVVQAFTSHQATEWPVLAMAYRARRLEDGSRATWPRALRRLPGWLRSVRALPDPGVAAVLRTDDLVYSVVPQSVFALRGASLAQAVGFCRLAGAVPHDSSPTAVRRAVYAAWYRWCH